MWEWYTGGGGAEIIQPNPEPAADGVCGKSSGLPPCVTLQTAGSRVERVPLTVKQSGTANPPTSWLHPICAVALTTCRLGLPFFSVIWWPLQNITDTGRSKVQAKYKRTSEMSLILGTAVCKKHMKVGINQT